MGDLSKPKRKRQLSVEEKLYAVKQVIYQNRYRTEVAIEMGVTVGTIDSWLRRYTQEGVEGLHPKRDTKFIENDKQELIRLQLIEKKYYEAQEDIEILKKFQASLKAKGKQSASKRSKQ